MNEIVLTQTEKSLLQATSRADALASLKKYGLPTRKIEAWHYTDLRANLNFNESKDELPNNFIGNNFWQDSHKIIFNNGEFANDLPKINGVEISKLNNDELTKQNSLFAANEVGNAVGWINSAFATAGIKMQINQSLDKNICFHSISSKNNAVRNIIEIANGKKAKIIECIEGTENKYLFSNIMEINVGTGAELVFVIDNLNGNACDYLARLKLTLLDNAKAKILIINSGGRLVRQELDCVLAGKNSRVDIYAANLIGGESHVDITSSIYHQQPSTISTEMLRNIGTSNGKGVFQGQIRVDQQAQLTDARMACNTLLLSDSCEFSAKPELEIFADDVQCAHGATLDDLEQAQLFYLMARGISVDKSRRLLISAFVLSMAEHLETEPQLVAALQARLDFWMKNNV